ncbi:uncharacterized protein LOC126997564 [Eriocheir sinensis]|uniref:uncharacterized protein LOC126997564 n=1 Tax=Eriocheir sinensis TaxID=95602 RepID=UPI0021C5E236|nr:uncharacterized protein LOC126997564 [Eriocheir sinensis]
MAGITTRSVARLLTSIRTTPTLRGSTSSTRTIASFKGLQSLAEPGKIPSEATEEDPFMSKHLDALSAWHEEADKMRDSRILPDGEDMQVNFSEQVVELLEEMVESGVLDPRTGWLSQMVSNST